MFKQIADLMNNGDNLMISITKKSENLIVTVQHNLNVEDAEAKKIPGITLKGTVEEFDNGFIAQIQQPLAISQKFGIDISEYEKKVNERKKGTEMEKKQKDKYSKIIEKAKKDFGDCKTLEDFKKLKLSLAEYKDKDLSAINKIIKECEKHLPTEATLF